MNIEVAVFAIVFVIALGSSLAMLFAKNAVHVALFLVGSQIALAGAFLLEGAFFVAVVQIIVYAGAIMVLFLFVIMLLGVDYRDSLTENLAGQRGWAVALGGLFSAEILYVAYKGTELAVGGLSNGDEAIQAINRDPGNVVALARELFSTYLLPFEATSVLLVVAIVGVMVLARRISAAGLIAPPAEVEDEILEEGAA